MKDFVARFPGTSLFLLALFFGTAPILVVTLGWLPSGFVQAGALSASLAGVVLAGIVGGRAGVRKLLRRGLIWRVGIGWWLLALLFPLIPTLGAVVIGGMISGKPSGVGDLGSSLTLLASIAFLVVFAGVGEEFGWRGFGMPRVQARYNALQASLAIGAFHWLWHTPLFFVKGVSQYELNQQLGFLPAFLGYGCLVVGTAVQLTWIFNSTGGSVLMAALYHGALNAWTGYIDIIRGGLPAVFTYTALLVTMSVFIVLFAGAENLSRTRIRVREGEGMDTSLAARRSQ